MFEKRSRPSFLDTVFIQVKDLQLLVAFSEKARDLNCVVKTGRAETEDFWALGGFFQVVDRTLIGPKIWECYLDWRIDVKCRDPLVVVDTENGVDERKAKNVYYTKSKNEILELMQREKTKLNRIEFYYISRWISDMKHRLFMARQNTRIFVNRVLGRPDWDG
jgi:hypothetical protein